MLSWSRHQVKPYQSMAGEPHQLSHPSSGNLISYSCLPLCLQTMNPERFQFLPGLLVLIPSAALFHSRLMLFWLLHVSQIPFIPSSRKVLSFLAYWQSPPSSHFFATIGYYLSFYSSEILRSNKDENMCSSCRPEPRALLKNLFEFCYELNYSCWSTLRQALCLSLIARQCQKCSTPDYIWARFY